MLNLALEDSNYSHFILIGGGRGQVWVWQSFNLAYHCYITFLYD